MGDSLRRFLEEQERIRRLFEPSEVEILRKLDRSLEMLRIAEPPALEQLRRIQENKPFLDQARQVMEACRPLQNQINQAFRGYRSHLDQFQEAIRPAALPRMEVWEAANRMLEGIRDVSWPTEEIFNSSRVMQAIMGASLLDQLSQSMRPDLLATGAIIASGPIALNSLRRSSLLVDAIAIADEEMSREVFNSDEFVARISEGITSRLASVKSPLERISLLQLAHYILAFIIPLLAMWMTYSASQESIELARESAEENKQHTESMVEVMKKIEDAVKDLSDQGGSMFIAVSPVALLKTADTDAEAILDIHPGDIVEILERSGDWARVAYYDRIQGQTVTGWVTVEVLRELSGP